MKFSCYKNDLTEALQVIIRAVAVKPMTPILSGIYLKAENSALELQSNNFSTGIIVRIPVNAEQEGETVVGGKRLQEFINKMTDETVTFSDEDSGDLLSIKSGGKNVSLITMKPEDFPKVKIPETERSFKIATKALRKLIRKTVFAVAKDDSRPIFTGCYFEIKGNKMSLVATNAHRLAIDSATLQHNYTDCSFVVPAETLRGVMFRIDPKDIENYVKIGYATRYVTFKFDNVFINSRIIEGEFPPYDRVIPKEFATNVRVDTNDFKEAIDFVALMSKETEYHTVKLNFRDNALEISSNSPDIGDATKSIEADIRGDEVDISFNVNYIADVIKVIDTDQVNIELNDRFSPAKFTEPENEDYVYIATPVRS